MQASYAARGFLGVVYKMFTSVEELLGIFLLLLKGQAVAHVRIRPQGVFCIFISDPKKTADFFQHQVNNLLLV